MKKMQPGKAMKNLAILLTLAGAVPAAHAAEYNAVQLDRSRITFVSRQMGVPVEGKFDRFTAQLAFDPARVDAARAEIEIDLASVDAGMKDANEELVGKNWFRVSEFPTARFVSTGVRDLGGGRYEAVGDLSIKGKTLPVTAPFTFRNDGSAGAFEGGFVLQRTAYGIGEGVWGDTDTVADEVEIKFHVVATPAAR